MVTRTSRGRYLEILEGGITVGIPIEVDVYDGANPDTMLATLDGAFDKKFTRELSELGAGSFKIARTDPKATPANMAVGNLIKFRVGGTYRHSIWIEEPATTTVSRDEEGGEDIQIDGRGALSYLERAVVYPPQWPTSAATYGNRTTATVANAKSITLTVPAGTTIGHTLIAVFGITANGVGAAPTGWSLIGRESNGSAVTLAVWRRVATSADVPGKTYKWTYSQNQYAAGIMLRLANASADIELYGIASDQGTGTSIKNPSVSVGLVDGVLLSLSAIASNTTMTPPSGLTEIGDVNTTGIAVEAAYVLAPAVGDTGDKTTVAAASGAWAGAQIFIPSAGVVDFTFEGGTFGDILTTLIDAAQARGAIPFMTYDFTDEVDSHGEPWWETHDLDFHIGTSLLEVWRHLVTLGLEGGMSHSLKLSAYNDASRHFEDSIILRKGHHIIGDVVDITHSTERRTRMLTEGAAGRVIEVSDSPAEVDPLIGRREGYLAVSTTDSAGTLSAAGVTALRVSVAEDRGRSLAVAHGLSDGLFEPWRDYREGDWISLDTTGTPVDERVVAITLEETEAGDFDVELELNSVEMDAFLRLNRRLDALMKESTSTGGGGMSSSSSSTPGTSKVGSVAGDSAGFLFDKLVTENITKSLVGDPGSQRVKLVATPPSSTLDSLSDVDVSSTPPGDGNALVWDDALQLWVPGAGGGGGGVDRLLARASSVSSTGTVVNPDPTSPTQVPGMTVTFTPPAGRVIVKCYIEFTSAGGGSRFALYLDGAKVWPAFGAEVGWLANSGDGVSYLWVLPHYIADLTAASHTIEIKETASGSTAAKTYYGRAIEVWSLNTEPQAVGGSWPPGSPDKPPNVPSAYDDEFDAALGGAWTTFGSLDVANANTDLEHHLHLKKNSSTNLEIYGKYRSCPAAPFTVTAKITEFARENNYQAVGLMVGDGSPGKMFMCFMPKTTTYDSQATFDYAVYSDWQNRASVGEMYALRAAGGWPQYVRIRVVSPTSMAIGFSMNGLIWVEPWGLQNPALGTVIVAGLWVSGLTNGVSAEAFIDWIRFT